jgi:glutamyl/glutaminyl-tRNA synthetase
LDDIDSQLQTPNSITAPLHTRFAPTPSGFLHLGNAYNLVLTWLMARSQGGRILLRIDDLDRQRVRPEYIEDVFRSLEWLGLDYDQGPSGPDDFAANWSQRLRFPLYEQALQRLRQLPDCLFPCALSRRQVREMSQDGQYPPEGRLQQASFEQERVAWRLKTPAGQPIRIPDRGGEIEIDLYSQMRDFVVRKKDGSAAYQLASLVDDLHFGINTLVRGKDLLPSSAAQLLLAERLGEASFSKASFFHHPLILGEDDQKLSKSAGSTSLQAWQQAGKPAAELYQLLAQWLKLEPVGSPADLLGAWREGVKDGRSEG